MEQPKEIPNQQNPEISAERINQIAYILKGIGHAVRLQIIGELKNGEDLAVGTLQERLDIEQTVLSHHLAKMRDLGLLTSRREGKSIYYQLKDDQIAQIITCMQKCDIF